MREIEKRLGLRHGAVCSREVRRTLEISNNLYLCEFSHTVQSVRPPAVHNFFLHPLLPFVAPSCPLSSSSSSVWSSASFSSHAVFYFFSGTKLILSLWTSLVRLATSLIFQFHVFHLLFQIIIYFPPVYTFYTFISNYILFFLSYTFSTFKFLFLFSRLHVFHLHFKLSFLFLSSRALQNILDLRHLKLFPFIASWENPYKFISYCYF